MEGYTGGYTSVRNATASSTTTETLISASNPAHLLKLADREFRQLAELRPLPPTARKFNPVRLNATRFDQSWDRKRGAAARLTAVLLREDDAALERRVCERRSTHLGACRDRQHRALHPDRRSGAPRGDRPDQRVPLSPAACDPGARRMSMPATEFVRVRIRNTRPK